MSEQKPSSVRPARPDVRQPSVMLSDLTADLLWPKILRAPALALSPSRLIHGTVCAFLLTLILQIVFNAAAATGSSAFSAQVLAIDERFTDASRVLSQSIVNIEPLWIFRSVWIVALLVREVLMNSPLIALLVGLPMIAVLAVVGGAISRSTAIEFSQGRYASRDDTLGFALRRARQFVGAVVGPVLFCAFALLVISMGGLLLSVPVLDVIGAVLYVFGLLLGIVTTIVLLLHVLALPIIVPALAVEGTDSFDAIQRSYAYVIAKPLRYLLYVLILLLLGILSVGVFMLVAQGSIEMTNWAATYFANNSAGRVVTGLGEMGGTKPAAHWFVNLWRTIIELIAAGYVISLFFTSSTLLYLVVRRFCDGQDINEVWDGVGE